MNDIPNPNKDWSLEKFGVGQPVPRAEDPRLLRGQGRYTDDVSLPGQAYAVMVRSAHAHGTIRGIDLDAARAMPGVLAILTGKELQAAGYPMIKPAASFPNRDGSPMRVRQGARQARTGGATVRKAMAAECGPRGTKRTRKTLRAAQCNGDMQ